MRNIDDIIADYLSGEELSSNDLETLESWSESGDNRNLLLFAEKLSTSKAFIRRQNEDPELALRMIRREIFGKSRRSIYFRRYAIAAGVVLLIGLTMFFGLNPDKPVENALPIHMAKSYAELKLADGRKIPLHPTQGKVILSGSDSSIVNDNNTVIYNEKDRVEAIHYDTLVVPLGAEYNLILSDGTKVYMNSGTKLYFPASFVGATRDVFLEGEAYFEVARDTNKHFVVHAGTTKAIVLGTSFNLRYYPRQSSVSTTLESGKLKVMCGNQEFEIEPGYQVLYDEITGKALSKKVDTELYTSWKDGYYLFNDTPLEEIMETISLWYNLKVCYKDSRLKNILFGGKFRRYDDIHYLLKMFAETKEVQFFIEGDMVTIYSK